MRFHAAPPYVSFFLMPTTLPRHVPPAQEKSEAIFGSENRAATNAQIPDLKVLTA